MRCRNLLLFLIPIVLPSPHARAQTASPYDMRLPARSVADCQGPLCTLINPAGLGLDRQGELLYLHAEQWGSAGLPAARGDGLFLSGLGLGFGLQYVRPDLDQGSQDYLKYNLVVPLFHHRHMLSLAAGLEVLDPTETDEDPSIDVLLGLALRPWRYLSFGAVGRNLAGSGMRGQSSKRGVELGLAARPLWFAPERLSLAADLRLTEDESEPQVRFSARASILDGIEVFASADLDGRFGTGLAIDFLRAGVSGYTEFSSDDGVENEGLVIGARASLAHHRGIILSYGRTAEIVLGGEVSAEENPPRLPFHRHVGLHDIGRAIRRAASDERIDALVLKLESDLPSITAAEELRCALADFRAAGKKAIVYLETATARRYFLATAADAIYLGPGGAFHVTGPAVGATFFRDLLDMLGVRAEAHRVGRYKAYVEPYTESGPSPGYQEVMNSLADEAADRLVKAIASGRGLAAERVRELIDRGVMLPSQAAREKLVDGVCAWDEIDLAIEEQLDRPAPRIERYERQRWALDRWGNPPSVAVVHAEGTIASTAGLLGGMDVRAVAQALEDCRERRSIDAVVLRIDSPGGSLLGAELIRRQVERLAQVKPVVVSMGSLAASGGYYIACPAEWIVANPSTLTGSIGVFSLLFDASGLLGRLGIRHEVVKRGELADLYSIFRGRTEREHMLLQQVVEGYYADFVQRVAAGRNLSAAEVDAVGQGRVWTGRQALERGLVDELGGLHRAIEVALERAGHGGDRAELVHLPKRSFSLGQLLRLFVGAEEPEGLPGELRRSLDRIALLAELAEEPAVAILPWWCFQRLAD
ncbi:MAG: signal peptide peptidase SppA [Deltaproteobacteria bacterium]|nr:signal peptide peptidase SppA [Deltaproteobacteria bacterium]